MKMRDFVLSSQRGSVLIIAVLILLMGSLVAVFSTTTSTLETRVANNEKNYTTDFYEADSGIAPGVKILLDTVKNKAVGDYPAVTWNADTLVTVNGSPYNTLLDEVIGNNPATGNGRGFTFTTLKNDGRQFTTQVLIKREIATTMNTGGSTEFGGGYEGYGYGAAGGVHIYYLIRPTATHDPTKTSVSLEARYRKVVEVGEGH